MKTAAEPFFDELVRLAGDNPDRVAFEFMRNGEVVELTRRGLIARVRRVGERMRDGDHRDGAKVALVMENRPAWAVGFFAAWYAGAVNVPLDPQLDPVKIGRIITHAETSLVVTSAKYRGKVAEALSTMERPPLVLDVDRDPDLVWDGGAESSGAPSDSWLPRNSPDGLGVLVYTSGTTGDPKGVMLEREGIVHNMRAVIHHVGLVEQDSLLGVLPLYHMLPLLANCVASAYVGARTVYLDVPTPESILTAFRECRISLFACVPLFFYRFHERVHATLAALPPLKRHVARLLMTVARVARRRFGVSVGRRLLGVVHRPFGPDLRLMLTGGAKMNPEVYDELLDWGFPLAQGYGLTEATAALTVSPLDDLRATSVGMPLPGIELDIRNAGADGIGEIWARSETLMRGYYKNQDATAAALVDGWLRTGDLGRLSDDGHLSVTGRAKDVIVLSTGKNVYPEELDEHFGQSELIAEICIVGREDPERQGAERLHAVVVPDLDAARRRGYVNVREMVLWELENLGSQLPSWQRPNSISLRNEPLPRTTTRKVRRFEVQREVQQATDLELAEAAGSVTSAGPTAEDERDRELLALAAVRAGREFVLRRDHLDLDLGLDSLDRVELITEIAARLRVRPDPKLTAGVHTVGELIDLLRAAPSDGAAAVPATLDEDARWRKVLTETPDDEYRPYLRRRFIAETWTYVVSRIIRTLAKLVGGFRVTGIEHLPRNGPFLLCPNHTSYLDVLMITAALPRNLLARTFFVGYSEYFRGWIGRAFSRFVRNIPIDQNQHLERSLQATAEGLRRGLILVAFPEGARSLDGNVLEFRRGPAILARQLDAPLVPAGIWGAHEAWPREGRPRPHPIGVAFGPALSGSSADPQQGSADLSGVLRERVVALIEVARGLF